MKKRALLSILVITLINILTISAINLDISSKPISDAFIVELDQPAKYELTIRNLGENDTNPFEIYTIVGIDIIPKTFEVKPGETKILTINLIPQETIKEHRNIPFRFEYKIKDSNNELQKQTLSMSIINLESTFSIQNQNLDPKSETTTINIKNNVIHNFTDINLRITSAFFDYSKIISLEPKQEKRIIVPIDREKLKILGAGDYLTNVQLTVNGKTTNLESQIKFLEQEGVEKKVNHEGFLIKRSEFYRKNTGNIRKSVTMITEKNILSSIFTFTEIKPTKTEINGLTKIYTWEKELIPNEELKIIVKTNWLIPIIIIIIIFFIFYFTRKSAYSHINLIKKVTFVKTKGGQFALKVTLKIKAKDHVEKIQIIDRLPPLVKLYEKFGLIKPDKIDNQNKRLEWNIESLNKEETRIFTYIIYSKIGVVGRFELPDAKAVYEKDKKIKEVYSNKSFYINEPVDESY
jgi:hypothetical protein